MSLAKPIQFYSHDAFVKLGPETLGVVGTFASLFVHLFWNKDSDGLC